MSIFSRLVSRGGESSGHSSSGGLARSCPPTMSRSRATTAMTAWQLRRSENGSRLCAPSGKPKELRFRDRHLRPGDASDGVAERRADVAEVFDPLVADLPEDQDTWDEADRARWLLAHSLDYFRRENNVVWWEFFERRTLETEAAFGDRKAIGGLVPLGVVGETGKRVKKPVYRYRFPQQDLSFGEGDELHEAGGDVDREPKESKVGSVHEVHESEGFLDIVKSKGRENDDPDIVFVHQLFRTDALEQALLSLGRWVVANGIDAPGSLRAGRDLLLRKPPRLIGGSCPGPLRQEAEIAVDAAVRLVQELDHGLLAIQGPPGAGKTHAGGEDDSRAGAAR